MKLYPLYGTTCRDQVPQHIWNDIMLLSIFIVLIVLYNYVFPDEHGKDLLPHRAFRGFPTSYKQTAAGLVWTKHCLQKSLLVQTEVIYTTGITGLWQPSALNDVNCFLMPQHELIHKLLCCTMIVYSVRVADGSPLS